MPNPFHHREAIIRGFRSRNLPDEISAVGAVGGLPKVGGHELVAIDLVDPASDSPLPLPWPHTLPEHSFFIVLRGCRKTQAERRPCGLVHLNTDLWVGVSWVGGRGAEGSEAFQCSAGRSEHPEVGWGQIRTSSHVCLHPQSPSQSRLFSQLTHSLMPSLPSLRVLRIKGVKVFHVQILANLQVVVNLDR